MAYKRIQHRSWWEVAHFHRLLEEAQNSHFLVGILCTQASCVQCLEVGSHQWHAFQLVHHRHSTDGIDTLI